MIANAIAERLTGRDYISYSALSTFAQCPLKYYFRYCLGMAEETVSASLVFGVAIHAAIQQHFEELLQGNPASWHRKSQGGVSAGVGAICRPGRALRQRG